MRRAPMDLAERGGGRRLMLEARELGLPVGAEFRHHAPLDEGPAHGRGIALQFGSSATYSGGSRSGTGRHQLGDLHDRALEAAERGGELGGAADAVAEPEQAARRDAGRHAADIGADLA